MQLFPQYYHSGGDGGSNGKGSRNFQKVRKLNYRCHILTQNRWGEYASAWLEKDRKDQAAEEKDRWSTLKLKWRTQFYFAGNDIWVWCSLGPIQKEKGRTSSQSKRFSKPLHKHIFSTCFRFRRVVSRHIEQERASTGLKSWLRSVSGDLSNFGILAFWYVGIW